MTYNIKYQLVDYRKKAVKLAFANIASKLRYLIYYKSIYYLLKYYSKIRNSGNIAE